MKCLIQKRVLSKNDTMGILSETYAHDKAYEAARVSGVKAALFCREVIGADFKLAGQNFCNAFTFSNHPGFVDRARSFGTFSGFGIIATISEGLGPVGANVGLSENSNISVGGGLSYGLDAGLNLSTQNCIVIPFDTPEQRQKSMDRYYKHH